MAGRKKLLFGFGSILSVLIIAGATYSLLDITTGTNKANQTKPAVVVQQVDSPQTIDSQIQSYMASEEKLEQALSDSELQTVTDDINSTQSLEDNYADL
jgi:hypothetical protein